MGKGKSKACKLRELRELKLNQKFSLNMSSSARNLSKDELGGVIFGCKPHTFSECISNRIFGLPGPHYSYVQKITPGLTLFLFNYTDRTLHGIFEAATHGQLNMNSNAWAAVEGTELTPYPAQVRVNVRRQCNRLIEKCYQPLIADNYYTETLFWFELDKMQTKRLTQLFLSSSYLGKKLTPKLHKEKVNNLSHSIVSPSEKPLPQDANSPNFFYDMSMSVELNNGFATAEKKWSELFKPSSSSPQHVLDNKHGSKVAKWSDLLRTTSSSHMMKDEEVSDIEKPNSSSLCGMENEEHMSDYPETEWESETVYEGPEIETMDISPPMVKNEDVSAIDRPDIDPVMSDDTGSDCESDSAASSYETAKSFLEPWSDGIDEELKECSKVREMVASVQHHEGKSSRPYMFRGGLHIDKAPLDGFDSVIMKLEQEIRGMKLCQSNQSAKVDSLKHQLVDSKAEIEELKKYLDNLESMLPSTGNYISEDEEKEHQSEESVYIIGGSNGSKWLQDMDSYFPSEDKFVSHCPMTSVRSFATAASLNGEVYLLGGSHDRVWYDTVESYNPVSNQWIQRPSLNNKKGSIAGASVYDKIFAIGGGNGAECYSDVEIFDLVIGRWLFTVSMLEKRVAPAATDLNDVLYVSGGYDGRNYLRTVERFDPREAKWTRISSMNSKRGSHSLVAFNEKLYALGGYDGNTMVSSVEVFDPRVGSWNIAESMILSRGYFGSFVLNGKLYALGGLDDNQEVLDVVECYEEAGSGWHLHGQSSFSKRCFFSTCYVKTRDRKKL